MNDYIVDPSQQPPRIQPQPQPQSTQANRQQFAQGGARREDSGSATSPDNPHSNETKRKGSGPEGRKHLSCENCRIRKMRCSRTSPCLSCKMRGDECVWIGAAPNGTANEDEVEATQIEVNRLKKLVDLLLTRLEQQDAELEKHFPSGTLPAPSINSLPPPASTASRRPPPKSINRTQYDPPRPQAGSNAVATKVQKGGYTYTLPPDNFPPRQQPQQDIVVDDVEPSVGSSVGGSGEASGIYPSIQGESSSSVGPSYQSQFH
ncbi:hypothetical protein JCM5350_000986 [Sporobolomyces pararoseus]